MGSPAIFRMWFSSSTLAAELLQISKNFLEINRLFIKVNGYKGLLAVQRNIGTIVSRDCCRCDAAGDPSFPEF